MKGRVFDWPWLPDVFLCVSFALVIPVLTIDIYKVFAIQHGVMHLTRGLALVSTVGYRSPIAVQLESKEKRGFGLFSHDMLISGHVAGSMLSMLIVLTYSESYIHILMSAVALSRTIVSNLACGEHYTSDVILAIVITTAMYY